MFAEHSTGRRASQQRRQRGKPQSDLALPFESVYLVGKAGMEHPLRAKNEYHDEDNRRNQFGADKGTAAFHAL